MTIQDSCFASSRCGLLMETSLVGSTLVNMTSSSQMSLGMQLFGSGVSQRLVGSCVAESTNHESGTGMMSPNLGGNVMCLNTSFSSCIRTRNEDKDFQNKNFTQGDRLNNVTTDVTSVTFTLCTFNEMTDAGSDSGGTAIFMFESLSSLTVRTCFFHACTATGNGHDGGAVNLQSLYENKRPVSISHSSFTMCSSNDCGGCLCIMNPESLLLDYCFFDHSKAGADGAVLVESAVITLSNTAFVDCSTTHNGGALTIFTATTLSISFCQFRGCSSERKPDARDILFDQSSAEVPTDMIQFCDSTSGKPNVYFWRDSSSDSSLVPQITTTPTVKSVIVTIEDSEATVVVETEEPISGTMSMLLNGSNVPRLVHVIFGDERTNSSVGTAVFSSGENGILPEATYEHHKWSLSPFPLPTIKTADASLEDWNTTEIVVKGVRLKEGSFWMEVEKEGTKWNITRLLI
ncbi:hypothetical protein BLNAU_3142 [Blattamonas nauphoetae]|uniref:Right handed beta helix domain-containing protein n=1 Tax=Blattamonas nauphoetae TaxID=2049346 RepID=A0ABQ9YD62_9EUKA|nr:hypothetical protein BLNAU_3142 [Blattamonas nauphoetae]